ncbi:MAG: efflux RND transporter permease subunit [Campylobacterota bacterium]|nr:efflux RND transporter permease subunit [Campylobacterota bacterium]
MFEHIIRFFVKNARMNYMLFFLIVTVGIYSYIKIPKEIFPSFDLDMVSVSGNYSGASLDVMDKMAVKPLEDEIRNIDGIKDMTTVINPGRFNIILELEKGVDKYNTSNKVKDALAIAKRDLPDDMDEPKVKVLEIRRALLDIAISSDKISLSEIKEKAQKLKDRLSTIKYISEVQIYGDSDIFYDIQLDTEKIRALGLDQSNVIATLGRLSYIFPLGKIEDERRGFFYLSTANGKQSAEAWEDTLIRVGDRYLYLKDIAQIQKHYEDSLTLYTMDTKTALNIIVRQDEKGNALRLAEEISILLEDFQSRNPQIEVLVHNNRSEKIKDRLNIVISNILLGLIIISLLVALLINSRMAFIIGLGIPTSFLIGAFSLYLFGYSINMISLIGVLIALGIIVDDAIVVSENIQQYIEKGYAAKDAAIQGAKEMAKPVTIASLTTLFAFIPALMISGKMGEVMKLIPIAVSALVIASLIESFLFLPIHAAHTLTAKQKTRSWEPVNRFYSLIIHHLMRHKKSFLLTFIIIVPLLTLIAFKISKFQMFPRFDSKTIHIAVKADVNTSVEAMNSILLQIQKDLYLHKKEFYIKHIGSVAGWRRDSASNSETYPYVGDITLELDKLKAQNIVDRYITPYLSFYYDKEGRSREEKSAEIAKKLDKFIKERQYKERFKLRDLSVVQQKVGPIKADIKIGLISEDNQEVIRSIAALRSKMESMPGIITVTDNIQFGIDEIKLHINHYGESLGIDEATIGKALSNLYLSRKISNTFNQEGLLEIRIQSLDKDNIDALEDLLIPLSDSNSVALKEIADFRSIKAFEKVTKDNGIKNFYLFANIDPKIITADEALTELKPILDDIQNNGIKIVQKGEKEKEAELKTDMLSATALAMVLIMLSMLYLFNSFRETFMLLSVIPFSLLGVMIGHMLLDVNIGMPSLIGMLGLAGVVINDGIIMLITLKEARSVDDIYTLAAKRFRPIVLTSITTLVGLSTLIFFPTGQAVIFQPLAIALGFGLAWGTVLNLLYLPVLYTFMYEKRLASVGCVTTHLENI